MGENRIPYNYYNDLEWLQDCYYKNGVLTCYDGVSCTRPIKLLSGIKIKISSFYKAGSSEENTNYGIRISFWNDGEWISDIDAVSTRDVEYVKIPEGCNSVSLSIREDTVEKYVYLYIDNVYEKNIMIYQAIKKEFETNCSFYGKSVSILGDSISTYGGNSDDTDPNFRKSDGKYTTEGNRVRYPQANKLELENVNDTWWMRLIVRNKMELVANESWAGSRVAWNEEYDNSQIGTHQGPDIYIGSLTRIQEQTILAMHHF